MTESTKSPGEARQSDGLPERERWADRVAMQVWIILFLLTLCIALVKFLIGF